MQTTPSASGVAGVVACIILRKGKLKVKGIKNKVKRQNALPPKSQKTME